MNGVILYRGASMLDGAPIVVIATGITKARQGQRQGANSKTGAMVQTYIMRADVGPVEAVRSGLDVSICGDCPARGNGIDGTGRDCYVALIHGPASVYRAFERGVYPEATPALLASLEGLPIRFGTYGDPVAAPLAIWEKLQSLASLTTGYTHQWRTVSPAWQLLVMASADSEAQRDEAQAIGYRTFRVAINAERIKGEVVCPASEEAGKKLQCQDCGACNGTASGRRGSIVIRLHGSNSGAKALAARGALIAAG